MRSDTVRERLLRSTVFAGVFAAMAAAPAFAQEPVRAQEPEAASEVTGQTEESAEAEVLTEQEEEFADTAEEDVVVVTGSRIRRVGVDTFYPAVSVTTETIEKRAFTNIADALNEVPSFGTPDASPQNTQNGFAVGQNFVDFLGLGSQRTLTLVNGRRFVSSNTPSIFGAAGGLQVDFNLLPLALVERIDTIGVGGAPIYGSDAIAGTINVILRDDFEGFEFSGQYGLSEEGDGENYQLQTVLGSNFANGKGNVAVAIEYSTQDGLLRGARPFYSDGEPTYAEFQDVRDVDGDGVPDDIFQIVRNVTVNAIDPLGFISPGPLFIPNFGLGTYGDGNFYRFNPDGTVSTFDPGEPFPGSPIQGIGGDGGDFFDNVEQLQSPLERMVFSGFGHYDIHPNVRAFMDFQVANSKAEELVNQGGFQSGLFGGTSAPLRFTTDNPFLSDQARNFIESQTPPNANGETVFYLNRFLNDIIDSSNAQENHLWRFAGGFQGDFNFLDRGFNWEMSYVHGESDNETFSEGIIDGRYLNAVDAIRLTEADIAATPGGSAAILALSGTDSANAGDIICRDVLAAAQGNITGETGNGVTDDQLPFIQGCVPLNLFGSEGVTDEARDWVTGLGMGLVDIQQQVFNANIGGELFELPAGPVSANVGFETRRESAKFQTAAGDEIAIFRSSPILPTGGSYMTDEFFGEIVVPLVSEDMDIPLLQFAEFNGAYRNIDNSISGEAEVFTLGGRFSVIPDVIVRGNYTESVRAPSVTELFSPQTTSFSFADDPCDERFASEGPDPQRRQANCAADIANYDPNNFTSNIVNATATGLTGGNPNLTNEFAESFTVGLTIEPDDIIPGLVITADYIDIEISDAITSLTLTQILNACYDAPNFPNAQCNSFTRDANGQIIDFETGQQNAATFDTEFLTFSANYQTDLADSLAWMTGMFGEPAGWTDRDLGSLSLNANLFHPLQRATSVVGERSTPSIGSFGDPKWSGTFDATWNWKSWRLFWRLNWQDDSDLSVTGENFFDDAEGNRITETDAIFVHNASLTYFLEDLYEGGPSNTALQLTVNNVFESEPDTERLAAADYTFSEIFGRSYVFRIRTQF